MSTLASILVIIGLSLFILIFFCIFISLVTKSLFNGAYFAETSNERMKAIFTLAKLNHKDSLLDLGSGDGRIVINTAKRGIKATGIEINPLLVFISKIRLSLIYPRPTQAVTIKQANLWNVSLTPYSVVIVYGIPSMMAPLEKKLKKELKPGSRVISVLFTFPTWKHSRSINSVYLYVV